MLESIFASDYHGLQLAAEKRGAHFSAKAYYTFSKALEDVDYQGGGLPAVQNSNRLELERGRTSNDRTHVFVLSGVWRIDYVTGRQLAREGAAQRLDALGHRHGCRAARRSRSRSGLDRNLDGAHQRSRRHHRRSRARQRAARSEELIEQWFNTAAFAQPAVGADGTAGRNIIDGPGFRNVDLGLFRDIRLGGRADAPAPGRGDERVQHRQPARTRARPSTRPRPSARSAPPATCAGSSSAPGCPSSRSPPPPGRHRPGSGGPPGAPW